MSFFTDPLNYEFFRQALIVATLVGALCGAMGVFIVLRRMSYIGHGLSHAAFGGAVVAYLMNISFFIGAGLWSFIAAILINAAARKRNIGADAAIGIVTTASFALGVALISKKRTFTRNFEAALFGNILGVSRDDILIIGGVTIAVGIAIFLAYKQLLFTTFDEEIASVSGVPTRWVETGFALALAATIVASMNIVGVTLIAAAIVIPPTTARMVTQTFGKLLILSTVIGAATGFFGMFVSFEYDIASGAAIVLLGTAIFLVVYLGAGIWHRLQPVEATPLRKPEPAPSRSLETAPSFTASADRLSTPPITTEGRAD
jgi:manganese/iron transport system permease protein/iron/zinc/copper transport system permease protein